MLLLPWRRLVLRPGSPGRYRRPARGPSYRPRVEPLEDLVLLSTFVVRNTHDAGPGSLRQAILDANANPGPDTIAFRLRGRGPHTIALQSPLPDVTDPVVIDGTTQPGFRGRPVIELDGSGAGPGANGLVLTAGGSTVRGLVVHSFGGVGILLEGNNSDTVAGNYLGTDPTGTKALGNGTGVEIHMFEMATGFNQIGGTNPADGNLISGNGIGIYVLNAGTNNNRIEGNFIGTDVTGTVALGNRTGVLNGSQQDSGDTLGGTAPGAGNLISGNGTGVVINDSQTTVEGNLIGTDVTGTVALGNGVGVHILSEPHGDILSANVISGNAQAGVQVEYIALDFGSGVQVRDNYIGTDITGSAPLGNGGDGVAISGPPSGHFTLVSGNVIAYNGGRGVAVSGIFGVPISGNAIWANAGLGIELDNGGNHNQEFPDILTATSDGQSTTVTGTLTSAANTTFTLEFFANTDCDPSGYGQGETPLGTTQVRTNSDGTTDFSVTFASGTDVGQFITATATDFLGIPANTSEFSACVAVTAPEATRLPMHGGESAPPAPWVLAVGQEFRTPARSLAGTPAEGHRSGFWSGEQDARPPAGAGANAGPIPGNAHAGPALHPRAPRYPANHAGVYASVLDEALRELW